MLLLLLLAMFGGPGIVEEISTPENSKNYWEDLVPIFEDQLEADYGPRARKFAPWILEASDYYEIDPVLLSRLIFKESSFRTQVTSRSGAVGPAQIKPRFWASFCGAHDLRDPRGNVMCSAQILAHLELKCGGIRCAINYYRKGHTGKAPESYIGYILNNS